MFCDFGDWRLHVFEIISRVITPHPFITQTITTQPICVMDRKVELFLKESHLEHLENHFECKYLWGYVSFAQAYFVHVLARGMWTENRQFVKVSFC